MNANAIVKENHGYCHCCRKNTIFTSHEIWLRDHYKCQSCQSIPRQRHLQYILDTYHPDWEKKTIHESSPSNNFIKQFSSDNYSSSQFFPEIEPGIIHNGTRCENLENLTFPEDSFDIFITQDVFEHVFHPELAAKEIIRVLRPGGIHIFTAPKHKWLKQSRCRASIEDGKITYLMEEQYHGNPVGDGRALVTWDYGDDFEHLLYQWCKQPTISYVTRDQSIGIDGEFLEVFVTRKFKNQSNAP